MEWISVKDRLPEVGTPVLAFNKKGITLAVPCGFYAPTRWIEEDYHIGDYVAFDVTHWMLMPEQPKED